VRFDLLGNGLMSTLFAQWNRRRDYVSLFALTSPQTTTPTPHHTIHYQHQAGKNGTGAMRGFLSKGKTGP
jgi:hypothetical protein